jgi:hypothetical protein
MKLLNDLFFVRTSKDFNFSPNFLFNVVGALNVDELSLTLFPSKKYRKSQKITIASILVASFLIAVLLAALLIVQDDGANGVITEPRPMV